MVVDELTRRLSSVARPHPEESFVSRAAGAAYPRTPPPGRAPLSCSGFLVASMTSSLEYPEPPKRDSGETPGSRANLPSRQEGKPLRVINLFASLRREALAHIMF